ncbi:MAG TPA: Smr/MutS family protein [Ginsengibacter sp.]|nr:Smr/MutS family protein [Ginsengibacter sp.]
MKYSVGDKVLLLHSNETGEIVEIMSDDLVMVNVDGIEFPVFTDQIDFPYYKMFSEASKKKQQEPPKVYIDQIKAEKFRQTPAEGKGVQLLFFPVYDTALYEDDILHFKVYLANQNAEEYYFEYNVIYREKDDFSVTNTIQKFSDFYLHNILIEDLNDIVKFHFLFSLTSPDPSKAPALELPLKIKPRALFQKIDEMHLENRPSFSFDLFNKYPDRELEPYFPLPEKIKGIRPLAKTSDPVRSVIDLHIEKIIDDKSGLSNYEILQIQLNYFEKYYQMAVKAMQPKLIVIHGVGSGKLRQEIHERLKTKSEVKSFTNQYHPNFGFGATEIYLQY